MEPQTSTSPNPAQLLASAGIDDPPSVWADFLERVLGDAEGLIDLRFIREKTVHRIEVATIDEAVSTIESRLDWNCYFGVARRRLPESKFGKGAGGKANLSQLSAVWLDWDPAKSYIDTDDAIGHREEFLISLEALPPCHPHVMVWSGAGFHCYWLFEEPEDVSTPESVRRVEGILRALARHAKTDPATTDASRILRVPATVNWPGAAKRAQGRQPSVAAIYQPDNGGRI